MMQPSPTWGNYQSMIQLAAGLNFAYAGLEALLRDRLSKLFKDQELLLEEVRQRAPPKKGAKLGIDVSRYLVFCSYVDKISTANEVLGTINPPVFAALGVVSIILLLFASSHSNAPIPPLWRILTIVSGYLWFSLITVFFVSSRLLVDLVVEPLYRSAKESE